MRPLNIIDHIFLLLEKPSSPMHVAGLCIFELPNDAPPEFVSDLARQVQDSKIKPNSPFNQILHRFFFWRTDENFDVQNHFRYVKLPKNSNMRELMDYVSHEHQSKMDKSKSLWEFHLIDGIAPANANGSPRCALFLKIHHAMADGIAAMRLLQMSFSDSPTEKLTLPFWSSVAKKGGERTLFSARKPFFDIIKEQLGAIYPVGVEVGKGLMALLSKNADFVSTFHTPKSIFNQKITNSRCLVFVPFEKERFSVIAKQYGATTNDVLLAVCAGAIRRYLMGLDALPNKPLTAFVPISLRRDDSAVGNQLSFILANLATHEANPVARLSVIKASVSDGKQRFTRMNQTQVINYSLLSYGWAFVNLAFGISPRRQAFNLIISNVPGNSTPLYLNGAKLTGIFPASVLMDGQAINITFANYQDKIDFGIVACPSVLPNIQQIATLLEDELHAFEQMLTQ